LIDSYEYRIFQNFKILGNYLMESSRNQILD